MIPQIRSNHPYSYRSGEWATIVGVHLKTGTPDSPRPCYVIIFDDGLTDLYAIYDPDSEYEYRNHVVDNVTPESSGENTRTAASA